MRFVCSRSSRPGSKFSVMRSWLERTATPLHTHKEQSTSSTWRSRSEVRQQEHQVRGLWEALDRKSEVKDDVSAQEMGTLTEEVEKVGSQDHRQKARVKEREWSGKRLGAI